MYIYVNILYTYVACYVFWASFPPSVSQHTTTQHKTHQGSKVTALSAQSGISQPRSS